MSDDEPYDPWVSKPSSAGKAPALRDPEDREDPDRPMRIEDLIPRHAGTGQPKIWLPDGSKMEYYFRPSDWGNCADNSDRLSQYHIRETVSGYLDYGRQSETLILERSALGPKDDDIEGHNQHNKKAHALSADRDRVGTGYHKLTERLDLGLPLVGLTEQAERFLAEWQRLTRHMQIVTLDSGPAVECFVAMDQPRIDQWGMPWRDTDGFETGQMIRGAGTFDRLIRYRPCTICGRQNRIADLKTGKVKSFPYAQRKSGIQLGVYSRAELYYPWPDGTGADRVPLPDTCPHSGILIAIDAATNVGATHWVDLARGFHRSVCLIPQIKDHQREQDWTVEFIPVPNLYALIDACTSDAQVREIYRQYPGQEWQDNDGALTQYASDRVAVLNDKQTKVIT